MLFVEFLQVALGNLKTLPCVPSKQDWHHLFAMAQKQTLIGVCFKGIQRLPLGTNCKFTSFAKDEMAWDYSKYTTA